MGKEHGEMRILAVIWVFAMICLIGCGNDASPVIDTEKPMATLDPQEGATVKMGDVITVTFSEEVDPSSMKVTVNGKPVVANVSGSVAKVILPDIGCSNNIVLNVYANDKSGNSMEVKIAEYNVQKPVANAGEDKKTETGELAFLDGSSSYSQRECGTLIYKWEADPGNPTIVKNLVSDKAIASFTPTVAGVYKFRLTVNDGFINSEPDEVSVDVTGKNVTGFTQGERWHISVFSVEKKDSVSGVFQSCSAIEGYTFLILELKFQELKREADPNVLDSRWLILNDNTEFGSYNVNVSDNCFILSRVFLYENGDVHIEELDQSSITTLFSSYTSKEKHTINIKWGFIVPVDANVFKLRFLDYTPIDLGI